MLAFFTSSFQAPKSPVISSPSLFSTADLTTSFCPHWASYPSSSTILLLPALLLSWNHPEVMLKTAYNLLWENPASVRSGIQTDTQPSTFVVHLSHPMMPRRRRRRRWLGGNVEWFRGKNNQSAGLQQIHCHRPALYKSLFCLDRGHIVKRGQMQRSYVAWSSVVRFRMETESVGCQRGMLYTPDKSRRPPPCSSTSSHRHHTYLYDGITQLAIIYCKLSLIHLVFLCLSANSSHGQRRCVFRLSVDPILVKVISQQHLDSCSPNIHPNSRRDWLEFGGQRWKVKWSSYQPCSCEWNIPHTLRGSISNVAHVYIW